MSDKVDRNILVIEPTDINHCPLCDPIEVPYAGKPTKDDVTPYIFAIRGRMANINDRDVLYIKATVK